MFGMTCLSYSALAIISESSSSTYSEVGGCPRTRPRAIRACSTFPFLTKYRGDSGKKKRPVKRMTAGMNCIPIGIRYEDALVRFSVP